MGNFNAKVGSETLKEERKIKEKFSLGQRNTRGDALITFCHENNLSITNILFQQHPRKLTPGHHQMVKLGIR